jgi:hypothetical protein
MRLHFLVCFALAIATELFLISSAASSDESPDLLQKAPEHLLKKFLASPDSEPGMNACDIARFQRVDHSQATGDEDREFFLTDGGFLVSNGESSNKYKRVFSTDSMISSTTGVFTFTPVAQVEGGACADGWELASRPSRIFDCFMFFNEIKMLQLRLRVHSPVVDFFIIRCLPVRVFCIC